MNVDNFFLLSTLLNEMDGVSSADGLIVVGATNRLDSIDPALLRSGRFGHHIQVNVPTLEERIEILHVACQSIPMAKDMNWLLIGEATAEWSGAELRGMCREAAMSTLRGGRCSITQEKI